MYHTEQTQDIQDKVRIKTQPLDVGMKKKQGPTQLTSDRRKTRTPKNQQAEDLSERQSVSSSTPSSSFITNEQQEKMMVLSADARQALIQMQRFDRFIYVMESEKRLKGPIEKQLRRLEKIKNSGNKTMKSSYFDNELTITCLFNHMKNMYQMNRDLGEIVVLKAEIQSLQQKIIDQNMKYHKDIKQASTAAKGKFAEQSQQLKQTIKFHENIISALKEVNLDRSKKKIEGEIKKYTEDKKVLLELISDLVSRANAQTSAGIIDTFTLTLDKITQDQGDINNNLTYLEKQRKGIEKLLNDPRTDQGKKKALQQLLDTTHYIISIYGLAKSSQGGGSKTTTKAPQTTRQQSSSLGDKKLLRQLQEKLRLLQQQGNTWIAQFQTLVSRLQGDENILTDINKHKKLLGVKKNLDPTISGFTQLILNILQVFNRKIREQNQSSNSQKEKSTQIQRLTKINATLQKQVQQLKDQIKKSSKQSQKQPNVEAQWTKLINILNDVFSKRQQNDPSAQTEINKAKKFIDLNRKKFPVQLHPLLNTIQYLIKFIIDGDNSIKQLEQQDAKRQQNQSKNIANLQTFSAGLDKLLTSGDAFNDGYLNKLKKNLEITFGKLEKVEQTPVSNLYLGSLDNTWKIIQILEKIYLSSKEKDKERDTKDKNKVEPQIKKQDLLNLQAQIKSKDQQIKSKDQQLKSIKHEQSLLEKKLKQYQRKLQELQKQKSDKKSSIEDQRRQKLRIQESQKQTKGLQKQIQRLNRQIERLVNENKAIVNDRQIVVVQYQKQMKKLNNQLQNSSNIKQLERENNQLKKSVENLNRSVNDGKSKEVERMRKQIEQLKSIQKAQQESVGLKNEEIDNLKRKLKDLEKTKTQVKYVENIIGESNKSGQGADYWRERYQACKMENEVLRDQLAELERRFDEVYIGSSTRLLVPEPQSYVKAQQADLQINRLKGSLAKQQALNQSQSLQIERYRHQQSQYKNSIQNLNQQIRNSQMAIANNTKSASAQRQISELIIENTKLQDQVINTKNQLNTTMDNLIFVDGQNFKIMESFKQSEERCKQLEKNVSDLEKSLKSGLQVSKLRDQKMDLERKYEELRRQMDIAVSQLQTQKQKPSTNTRTSNSFRIPGTPKVDKVTPADWGTNSQAYNNRQQTLSHTKSQASFNNSEKTKQVQILLEQIAKLQNQNRSLGERLALLSVYNGSMTGVNQTFVDNVNKMIQNLIRFMVDFEGISENLLVDNTILTQIKKSLKQKDYNKYFELSEEYLRNAITALIINKNSMMVTGQVIESREIIVESVVKKKGLYR